MTSQRKLDMAGTWSTVEKWPKRTPDITVKTTTTKIPIQGNGKITISKTVVNVPLCERLNVRIIQS